MANAQEVARYIVCFFQDAGDPVTNLKLQKLLYYVHGWSLALRGSPAFDDRMEAWVHGPVQPGVYGTYKKYRWSCITEEVARPTLEPNLEGLVREVLEAYGTDSAYELERRTHVEPPWLEARGGIPHDQDCSTTIKTSTMQEYFKTLIR